MKSSISLRTLGLAAGLALLATAPAQAQFKDPFSDVIETLGIKSGDKEPIVYRERAPLVVPPKTDRLRPPEDALAEKNARWPKDPDVLERRRRKAESLLPQAPDSDNDVSQGGILRNEPLGKRNRYAGVPTASQPGSASNESANPAMMVSREQVRVLNAGAKDPDKPTGIEPDRQYLTEPPAGYRRPAAGAPVRASVEPMKPMDDQVQINAMRPQR